MRSYALHLWMWCRETWRIPACRNLTYAGEYWYARLAVSGKLLSMSKSNDASGRSTLLLRATEETLEHVSIRMPVNNTSPGLQQSNTEKQLLFENLTDETLKIYRISTEGEETEHHTLTPGQDVRYIANTSILEKSSSPYSHDLMYVINKAWPVTIA